MICKTVATFEIIEMYYSNRLDINNRLSGISIIKRINTFLIKTKRTN